MPVFYKGIGPGTYWSGTDLRLVGLAPRAPGLSQSNNAIATHIADGLTDSSCYISLTSSYSVARDYAMNGRVPPSPTQPGHVYVIELNHPLSAPVVGVIDPVHQLVQAYGNPLIPGTYQHDGSQNLLLGIVDPANMGHHLSAHVSDPPGSARSRRPARRSKELEAVVMALRDAEILVVGTLPNVCFTRRYDVF
jgi:hypothetical protein